MAFRASPYIDFDTGFVQTAPMELARALGEPPSFEERLNLFECRVDVWQLGPAVEILKQIECHPTSSRSAWAHAAFALLAVAFTYFEMLGKTLNPSSRPCGTAGADFDCGFWDVYPEFRDKEVDTREFRNRVRNGMYHLAFTKRNLLLHNNYSISREAFFIDASGEEPVYFVNPHAIVRRIVDHFPTFVGRLRATDSEADILRRRFEGFLDEYHDV